MTGIFLLTRSVVHRHNVRRFPCVILPIHSPIHVLFTAAVVPTAVTSTGSSVDLQPLPAVPTAATCCRTGQADVWSSMDLTQAPGGLLSLHWPA